MPTRAQVVRFVGIVAATMLTALVVSLALPSLSDGARSLIVGLIMGVAIGVVGALQWRRRQ